MESEDRPEYTENQARSGSKPAVLPISNTMFCSASPLAPAGAFSNAADNAASAARSRASALRNFFVGLTKSSK